MIRPGIRRFFHLALRRRRRTNADVDAEIQFHLELRAEQLAARGVAPDDARREAVRRFGAFRDARRTLRDSANRRERTMHRREWLDELRQDLRYAVRGLLREPGFAVFVIVTLALGIGANATMFGVADRLLLRGPEHVRDVGRVARLYSTESAPGMGDFTTDGVGYVTYALLHSGTRSFEGVGGYAINDITIEQEGTDAALIRGGYATADFFPLLGVRPLIGRFFGADEDRTSGAEHVAVLSDKLWKQRFAGDSGVLGRTVTLGEERYVVVGVAPPGFTGVELGRVDVWLPMSLLGVRIIDDWTTGWNAQWMELVVRLKPGVTAEQAGSDATAAHRAAYTGTEKSTAQARLSFAPLRFDSGGKESTETMVSRWLVGVAAIVLLIACLNVGNLLLARALGRRREVAVRLTLGAGRARLVRLLLTESLLLSLAGGAAGILLAVWGGQFVRRVLLPEVEWTSSPVDVRVLVFSAMVAVGTGILVGLVPALRASRTDLATALRAGVREGKIDRSKLRGALTIAQAALSVVLLVGAGLFVRSLQKVRGLDLGLQPDRVLDVDIYWPSLRGFGDEAAKTRERGRRAEFFQRAMDESRRLPQVERATLAAGVPFRTSFSVDLSTPGRDSIPRLKGGGPYVSAVAGDYFQTVGTRIVRGRGFTSSDGAGTERVAVVSELMAQLLWPGGDAIGQCLKIGGGDVTCARIVGVVADTRRSRVRENPSMRYYVPLGQENGFGGTELLVRPRATPEATSAAVRRMLRRLDPSLGYVSMRMLQEEIDPQIRPWRLGASVFGVFGLLALVVAAFGLYSVISYIVAQRTHEIGVRLAVGARAGDITWLIMRRGLGTAAIGIVIGLGIALAAGRFAAPMLFETSPRSPEVLSAVSIALLLVAAAASLVPAWRARRIDPLAALRDE